MPRYVRPSKQIGLRLPPEMLAWLEAAASEDRTVAYVIKRLIAAEMAREAKKARTAKS